ncbi:MAG: GNAT family N-acetyltransferase [Myxococcota bacterium]|nr:GNAT family N-acetyltransferase [Myxococcota bacterium]
MQAHRISPEQRDEVLRFLRPALDTNLFLVDILTRRPPSATLSETWFGIGAPLLAVAVVIGRAEPGAPARLVVPFGDAAACEGIGACIRQDGPVSMLIGPRAACDGIWKGLGQTAPKTFFDQRLYRCTEIAAGHRLPIRLATIEDAERIAPLSAAMMVEDLGEDPRAPDPAAYLESVRSRCARSRTLLSMQERSICFLLNIGTFCDDGVQVGGTYVPPDFRGQGIATAGMRASTATLLSLTRSVTLHVNEANLPAVRCYERSGFVPASPFRLIIQ